MTGITPEMKLADLNVLATKTFAIAELIGVERLSGMKASYPARESSET